MILQAILLFLVLQHASPRTLYRNTYQRPHHDYPYHKFHDSNKQHHINRIPETCPGCSTDAELFLRKLHHHDAVCNDGTKAGYYIRKVNKPHHWVIYLQGGFYCNDVENCQKRQKEEADLTGSKYWPRSKTGEGILSTDVRISPLGWGSNLVYIPYCTSDLWLGDSSIDDNHVFNFRGARVIDRVIEALIADGMQDAHQILVTGTSAGGVGVMFHIDKIAFKLKTAGSRAEVRGISDSGWFIETGSVPERGNFRNWQVNKTIGNECLEINKDNQWKCLYGRNIYPNIKSPLMIVQFYIDPVQIQMHGFEVADILRNLSDDKDLRSLVDRVTLSLRDLEGAVFGVSCLGHGILDDTLLFSGVEVRNVTLMKAIECWYEEQCPQRNMDSCDSSTALCNESCMTLANDLLMKLLYGSFEKNYRDSYTTRPPGTTSLYSDYYKYTHPYK